MAAEAPWSTPSKTSQDDTFPLAAMVLLIATVVLALLWSHFKLFWYDEFLQLHTDGVGTVSELLRIQRHYAISLDPALFHLLEHASTRLFGVTPFGLRIVSLLGYLLMQVSLFFFVGRIAGQRAGIVALALPVLTGTLYYAVEARPYGLLLGWYGLAVLCYQAAARNLPHRRLALVGLAFAIACAINTHYFGILVLLPIGAAELVRTLGSHHTGQSRLDWPMIAALAGSLSTFALLLPFHAAAARYGLHYYTDGTVNLHTLINCYRILFLSDMDFGGGTRIVLAVLALSCVAAAISFLRQRNAHTIDLPANELVLLLVLTALPFFGYLIALVVTHTFAVRYVFAAMLAISAVIAIGLSPWLRRTSSAALTAVLLALFAAIGLYHVHHERERAASTYASLVLSPQLRAELFSGNDGLILMQNPFTYEKAAYYEPDPAVRSRLALLYSDMEELHLRGRDTSSLTADNMRHFTGFPILGYEQVRQTPGTHHMIVYGNNEWDWTLDALRRDGATVRSLGPAFGGDAIAVTFPDAPVTNTGSPTR